MPTEKVFRKVPIGKTYAEVWQTASQSARERMVLEFGRFVVQPGRHLPIERKVVFVNKSGPKGAPGVSLGDIAGMVHYPENGAATDTDIDTSGSAVKMSRTRPSRKRST